MKKFALMLALFCGLLFCGACAAPEATPEPQPEVKTEAPAPEEKPVEKAPEVAPEEVPEVEEEAPAEPVLPEGDVVLGGQGLFLGKAVTSETLEALGEPVETMEAPSCHFDGMDTIYYYDDFALYTYLDGEDNVLYLAELSTANVATTQGATVGMAKDDLLATMGNSYEELGLLYSYDFGTYTLDFSFDDQDCVSLIEYVG